MYKIKILLCAICISEKIMQCIVLLFSWSQKLAILRCFCDAKFHYQMLKNQSNNENGILKS